MLAQRPAGRVPITEAATVPVSSRKPLTEGCVKRHGPNVANIRAAGIIPNEQQRAASTRHSAQRHSDTADQIERAHGKQLWRYEAEGVAGTDGCFGRD